MLYFVKKCTTVCAIISLCFASSCDVVSLVTETELPEPNSTVFTINQGSHYASNNSYKRVTTNLLKFEATFDNTAVYTTKAAENQGDINKLYGVSDCGSEHHTNSARFGWRWYQDRLEIHAYTYINKKRVSEYIGEVELGKSNKFELELKDEQYVFKLNDRIVTLPRGCSGAGNGYKLYPYFGGDETAPHNITIKIKELK